MMELSRFGNQERYERYRERVRQLEEEAMAMGCKLRRREVAGGS